MKLGYLVLLFALMLTSVGPAATASSGYAVDRHPLPEGAGTISAMTVDPAGNVWLIQDSPPVLYKLGKENGTLTGYPLKGFAGAGFAGLSADGEGTLWFADLKGNRVGAYEEESNHTATFGFPGPMAPSSVVRSGNSLFIGAKEEVGEMDLGTGEFADHFVYKMDSYVYDVRLDRLGNVWFVENQANKVGAYFRMYDTVSEFDVPTPGANPACLAIDSRGRLWFVENSTGRLGIYDTEQFRFGGVNLTPVDGILPVIARVAAVNDTVWATDVKNGRLLRYSPDEDRFAAADLGNDTYPTFVEADTDGSLWVYESGKKTLAHVSVGPAFGAPTVTPIPTPTQEPTATAQPTATPAPTPTPAPGFEFALTAIAILAAAGKRSTH